MDIEDLREGDFGTTLKRGATRTEMWHAQKMAEAHMRDAVKDWTADEVFVWCQQTGRGLGVAMAKCEGDFTKAANIQQSVNSAAALFGMRCWLDAQDAKDEESQHEGDQNAAG